MSIFHRPGEVKMSDEEKNKLALIPGSFEETKEMARTYAKSALLPAELRGKPQDVFVTLMAGRELGLQPMASLRMIHVIDGKPILSADAMAGVVISSGQCEYFRSVKSDGLIATYETKRRGQEPQRMSFTLEEAKLAGLLNRGPKSNWAKYPSAMLRARAKAALARDVYPDVLAGVYEPGEAMEFTPLNRIEKEIAQVEEVEVIDAEIVEEPELLESIRAAKTLDELSECATACKDVDDQELRSVLRDAYKARLQYLRSVA